MNVIQWVGVIGVATGVGGALPLIWSALTWPRPDRCGSCLGSGSVRVLVRCGTNGESEPVECWTCDGTGRERPGARGTP